MRASAAAKLAEITEVCCADTRILHAKASQVMECHAVFYELTFPAHQLAPYFARFCSLSPNAGSCSVFEKHGIMSGHCIDRYRGGNP